MNETEKLKVGAIFFPMSVFKIKLVYSSTDV